MASTPVVNGIRLGSLVEIGSLPRADGKKVVAQQDFSGQLGQLVAYDRENNKATIETVNGFCCQVEAKYVQVPTDLKRPGNGGDADSFDIFCGPRTNNQVLGEELAQCVFEKGFCVLKVSEDSAGLPDTVKAVQAMCQDGKLGRLPIEVEEGYLGRDGTGKVFWMNPDDSTDLDDALVNCDAFFSQLAEIFQPFSEDALGRMIAERTPALVSLTLSDEEEDDFPHPMADNSILGDYLGTWRRGLLRAVRFMGPTSATVTLESRDDQKADKLPCQVESVEITASPNTVLIFRTECQQLVILQQELFVSSSSNSFASATLGSGLVGG